MWLDYESPFWVEKPQRLATVQPGGQDPVQHWAAGVALVVSGGLGMPDVHGRPAAKDVTAANCDHAHVRVVTASDVHFSRELLGDVLEQALLAVRQDVIDRPSPPDGDGSRCRYIYKHTISHRYTHTHTHTHTHGPLHPLNPKP